MNPGLMRQAIALAIENVRQAGGGPFGALVARGGKVVATGVNRVTTTNDPTAHAEVVAIREACRALGEFQLTGCEIYTTCEPCPMCLGAIYWARPDRVYFACTRRDAAEAGFDDSFIYEQVAADVAQRTIPMVPLLRDEAQAIFRDWKQKSGKVPY
ncbi:MAG: nucleoside deaminase [Bryobacteraceae bacterium]